MKIIKINILFFLLLFLSISLSAQYKSRGESFNYEDAENFYNTANYYDALPLYKDLHEKFPKILEYRLKMGICYLYLNNSHQQAIENIKAVYNKKPKTENIQYYLAKAYALNYQFDKAIELFNKSLTNQKTSETFKKEISHLIEQCKSAKELVKDSLKVEIVNLGSPINSSDNEYSPTVNADESTLIYTYRGAKSIGGRQDEFNRMEANGNFYEDIYISKKENDKWSNPVSISDSINSNLHEGSIALSPDGQTLFIYKDTKENSGDIFISNKGNNEWSEPRWLNINSEYWEGSAAISPDGKTLFFSSDREGGLGGKDLYKAIKQEDGNWGDITNLGPTINTAFDDDAPFIHSDGVTFNFSSKGHQSIGGYDIFESKITTDSTYGEPRNIGYPINTTADDIFFFVSGRGNAYYSSSRQGGLGQQDIYVINVKEVISSKPVLLVKGIIKSNGNFVKSKIVVRTESGKDLGSYYSDASDGKYQFYIDLNDYYVIAYEYEGFTSQIESIDATKYTEYAEIEKNINFDSRDVKIEGVALIKEQPLSPLINLRVRLSNGDKTINKTDTTDENGYYSFSNLPNDDYYLLFLDEEDEKLLQDSSYIFKGKVTLKGLPYANAKINDVPVGEDGDYKFAVRNKHFYGLLSRDSSFLKEMSEEDILTKFGNQTAEGVVFKVQVGAFKNAQNFNGKRLLSLGNIEKAILDDGITRFTMGSFSTLATANQLRNKVIEKGQEDAFIIIFINGKRTYLEELIKTGKFK